MDEFYKVVMSDDMIFLIEIKYLGAADYRANLLDAAVRHTDRVEDVLTRLTDRDWVTFQSSSSKFGALCNVLAFINEQRSFERHVQEVLPIKEPTRAELCNHWDNALDLVIELQNDVAAAQASSLQSAEYADEYKHKLAKAQQELKVVAQLAVELNDAKDQVEAFVVQHVKAEA